MTTMGVQIPRGSTDLGVLSVGRLLQVIPHPDQLGVRFLATITQGLQEVQVIEAHKVEGVISVETNPEEELDR